MSQAKRSGGGTPSVAVGAGWRGSRLMRVKLLLAMATVVAVALGTVGVAVVGMESIQHSSDELYQQNVLSILHLAKARSSALVMRGDVFNAALSADRAARRGFAARIPADDAVFDAAFAAYTATPRPGREQDVTAVRNGMREYRRIRDTKLLPAADGNNLVLFTRVRDQEGLPTFTRLLAGLDDLVNAEAVLATQHHASTTRTYLDSLLTVILALAAGLALGVGFALYLARLIVARAGRIVQAFEEIEQLTGAAVQTRGATPAGDGPAGPAENGPAENGRPARGPSGPVAGPPPPDVGVRHRVRGAPRRPIGGLAQRSARGNGSTGTGSERA